MKSRKKRGFSPLSIIKLFGQPLYYLVVTLTLSLYFLLRALRRVYKIKPRFSLPKIALPPLRINKLFLVLLALLTSIVVLAYFFIFRSLPTITRLTDVPPSLTTKIYDRHGNLLYQIYKDENRTLVGLNELPSHLIAATLAAEDKNFFAHHGVDISGIIRAAYKNFLNCKLKADSCSMQGGSTITQQLIKNTLLTPERTLIRKVKELVLSLQAELKYSKEEILTMYLNQVGYGGTAYGVEQASWQYFAKSARDLNLAESAFLAGLPISPTTLSPFGTNPHLAKIRQQQVLENMVKEGNISENEKVQALNTPLSFHPQEINIRAPHFVMYIKNLLVQQFGEEMVSRGGLVVTTSLDLTIQDLLTQEINQELSRLSSLNVTNGAGLVISPTNGEVLAMVGSRDFFDTAHDGQVNVTLQPRQPGSSIKPITYALALSRGLNPSSIIEDSPICFKLQGQPDYCPQNYDGKFHGNVTLRTALASSYNIPAIKLLNSYGLDNMISLAQQLGITTWQDPSRFGLSLTLGGGEITMVDLASVYSVFANGGTKIPLNPILSVTDNAGSKLSFGTTPPPTQVIDPAIAYQINSILSDKSARAPAFGFNSILNVSPTVAVKTGTTNNLRDNWTFGYTPNILVATWVGNNDNSPMSKVASGITGASPIWANVIRQLLPQLPPVTFTPPSNLVKANVSCTTPRYEYFLPGNTPILRCSPAPSSGTILEQAEAIAPR